jgi:hypothetical protein
MFSLLLLRSVRIKEDISVDDYKMAACQARRRAAAGYLTYCCTCDVVAMFWTPYDWERNSGIERTRKLLQ